MAENNRESNMRVSLLKTCVKKTLKWDLEMQSTRLPLLLCVFLFFPFFFICYSLLSASEKKEKKNNLDCAKTLKIQPPGQNPCWAYLSIKNSPSTTHWRMISFCLQMTSAIERSPIYLRAVLKIASETFVRVFGMRLRWSFVEMRHT